MLPPQSYCCVGNSLPLRIACATCYLERSCGSIPATQRFVFVNGNLLFVNGNFAAEAHRIMARSRWCTAQAPSALNCAINERMKRICCLRIGSSSTTASSGFPHGDQVFSPVAAGIYCIPARGNGVWALLGSNPTSDIRVRAGQWPPRANGEPAAGACCRVNVDAGRMVARRVSEGSRPTILAYASGYHILAYASATNGC